MRQATVNADYGQFYLQDVDAHNAAMRAGAATDPTRAAGGWTDEAVRLHRIGLEPHSISIGAARSDLVETVLIIHETAPALVPEAEHAVEADLDVVTGAVLLVGQRHCVNALAEQSRGRGSTQSGHLVDQLSCRRPECRSSVGRAVCREPDGFGCGRRLRAWPCG
jgi:hypothetical protein